MVIAAVKIDLKLVNRFKGQILLQVQQHGEAWYLNPDDGKRYYMKDGATAYEMMRKFGKGMADADLEKIPVGTFEISTTNNQTKTESTQQSSTTPKPKSGEGEYVTINLGESINLSGSELKFISFKETQVISSSLGNKVAKSGTKFVVVNLNATNTGYTKVYFPYSGLKLLDNKSREYEYYDGSIGYLDNYLEGRDLAPSITENGNIAFEVPTDSTSYGIIIGGSNVKNYFIKLK